MLVLERVLDGNVGEREFALVAREAIKRAEEKPVEARQEGGKAEKKEV